jgi:hypothetical protein
MTLAATVGARTVPAGDGNDVVEVQAPCAPGFWVASVTTEYISPPGWVPTAGILFTPAEQLFPTFFGPRDCLPVILNMNDAAARTRIAQLGLQVGTVTTQTSSATVDDVISWSLRSDNVTVDLVESAGDAVVPGVIGLSREAAVNAIQAARLVAFVVSAVRCLDPQAVLGQDPPAGTRKNRGNTVTVFHDSSIPKGCREISAGAKASAAVHEAGASVAHGQPQAGLRDHQGGRAAGSADLRVGADPVFAL